MTPPREADHRLPPTAQPTRELAIRRSPRGEITGHQPPTHRNRWSPSTRGRSLAFPVPIGADGAGLSIYLVGRGNTATVHGKKELWCRERGLREAVGAYLEALASVTDAPPGRFGAISPVTVPRELHLAFVRAAKEYGQRYAISYVTWREIGVEAATLHAAGIFPD